MIRRTMLCLVFAFCATSANADELFRKPQPRGKARIIYIADAMSDVRSVLPDDPTAVHLRQYVDSLADNGVDVYGQDIFQKQGVCWFYPRHKDHAHLPGVVDRIPKSQGPPIKIATEQCHRRGMKFIAVLRMADRHTGGERGLIAKRKDLWNPDFGNAAMDYSHKEIRDWLFAIIEEILDRFDVDGFEFTYTRWMHCFPRAKAEASHPLMTRFVQRVRRKLDEVGKKKGRKLMLGVRVPQTLKECKALGYDVPTWVKQELVDYISPSDFFYTDINAQYEEFARLTRKSKCMLYPTIHPIVCRGDDVGINQPSNYRAAARNMYAAGADGIAQFNYQYHWGRRRSGYPWAAGNYPTALAWLRQLRGTGKYDSLPRRYKFVPLWASGSPSGFPKNDHIRLKRKAGSDGAYRFRIAEVISKGVAAELIVYARCSQNDQLSFSLNGEAITTKDLKTRWHPTGRPAKFGRPLPSHKIYMLPLRNAKVLYGDNVLTARVKSLDQTGKNPIIIDELEVTIVPSK